jgi:prepilin-type N-terminal cleavage/methylation domain-containing protein
VRQPPKHARAFTLIELLVVLVILCSLIGIAVLSVGIAGPGRELHNEAERLGGLIGVLAEEAVLDNREYGLLLDICRFIYEEAMPTPHGEHDMTFRAFAGDWFKRKGRLFQNFVSRFYELRAADAGWEVQKSGTTFQHPMKPATPTEGAYLQRLEADVYVKHLSGRKVLIECKFYGKPFASKPKRRTESDDELSDEDFGAEPEAPGRKISNEHLLQLGAYMDGLSRKKEGPQGVEGLLLYVQPDEQPLSADFVREGVKGVSQPLRVRCLDLTKPWDQVEADLLGYLG